MVLPPGRAARDPDPPAELPPTAGERGRPRTSRVRLGAIAYARSGDKGDHANVGVAARSPEAYAFLRETLSAKRVHAFFRDLVARPRRALRAAQPARVQLLPAQRPRRRRHAVTARRPPGQDAGAGTADAGAGRAGRGARVGRRVGAAGVPARHHGVARRRQPLRLERGSPRPARCAERAGARCCYTAVRECREHSLRRPLGGGGPGGPRSTGARAPKRAPRAAFRRAGRDARAPSLPTSRATASHRRARRTTVRI